MKYRLFYQPIVIIYVLNLCVLIVGLTLTWRLCDPAVAQRTGSAVAAVTGLFVIWQVIEEIRMERELRRDSAEPEEATELLTLDRVARRLEAAKKRRHDLALREARLLLVVSIALWLSVGEGLHGFGDIAFSWVSRSSPHGSENPTTVGANRVEKLKIGKGRRSLSGTSDIANFVP